MFGLGWNIVDLPDGGQIEAKVTSNNKLLVRNVGDGNYPHGTVDLDENWNPIWGTMHYSTSPTGSRFGSREMVNLAIAHIVAG